MVFAVAVLGCGSSPDEQAPMADAAGYAVCAPSRLTLPLTETGPGGLAVAVVDAAPNPPAKHDNVWTLAVKDENGALSSTTPRLRFIETYMPVHEHSGVPAPTAERDESGVFRMQVPFMMRGPWEVRIDLVSQRAGTERVVFDVCVAE